MRFQLFQLLYKILSAIFTSNSQIYMQIRVYAKIRYSLYSSYNRFEVMYMIHICVHIHNTVLYKKTQ